MSENQEEGIRLNKYLSEAGVCSRRQADEAIEKGEVMIDGRRARLGDRVLPGETVIFREEVVEHREPPVLIMLNKPKGIVCTAEKEEPHNIVDYLNYPVRIYPVGRLDKDSRGLILLTNQGDLVNRLNRAGNYHEKEYIVKVDKEVTAEFLERMKKGIYLPELRVKTRPCKCWKTSYDTFHIVLTQGLNRQIRRMCEALDYHVRDLLRIRIMNLKLGSLAEGEYRDLTPEEEKTLREGLKNSQSAPKRPHNGYRKSGAYHGNHGDGGFHRKNEFSGQGGYHKDDSRSESRGYQRKNRPSGNSGYHKSGQFSENSGYHKGHGNHTYGSGEHGGRQNGKR